MQTTQPLLLRPSRVKTLGLAAVSLAFVLTGLWMVNDGDGFGWYGVGFFGLCLVIFLVVMLPNAAYLRITLEGFTMCSLYRAQTFRWVDVSFFGVGHMLGHRMVMFNLVGTDRSLRKLRAFNAGLSGYEAALPGTFGLRHAELAELMNRYKAASDHASPSPENAATGGDGTP